MSSKRRITIERNDVANFRQLADLQRQLTVETADAVREINLKLGVLDSSVRAVTGGGSPSLGAYLPNDGINYLHDEVNKLLKILDGSGAEWCRFDLGAQGVEIIGIAADVESWAAHETGGDAEATWGDYETVGSTPTEWGDLVT